MITHDIQRFSSHLAAIYANMAKPVLDVILYNYQLSQNVGAEGLVILTILVQLSAAFCASRAILFPHTRLQGQLKYRLASDSASTNTAVWPLHDSVRPIIWIAAPHSFAPLRVRGRDRILRWRGDREDAGRKGVCWTRDA